MDNCQCKHPWAKHEMGKGKCTAPDCPCLEFHTEPILYDQHDDQEEIVPFGPVEPTAPEAPPMPEPPPYACPQCGYEHLVIEGARAEVLLYPDGEWEFYSDPEWIEANPARCASPECEWQGTLEDCKPKVTA